MSVAFRIHDQSKTYFVTLTISKWIDLLSRPEQKLIIIDSLKHCQDKRGLQIFAYVIMSNHLHMICNSDGGNDLSGIIRDFKRYTNRRLVESLDNDSRKDWLMKLLKNDETGRPKGTKVWQRGYHAIEVSSNKFLDQKIEYIHNNPVRQMIVANAEEYLFSSARNYASLDNYMDVIVTYGEWVTY